MLGRTSSIRTLLSVLLAALILPLVAILAYAQYREVTASVEANRIRLLGLADAASMGIGQFLSESERLLAELANDPDIRSLDPERCPPYFKALGQLYIPQYTNLFTWTTDGASICSALDPIPGQTTVGRPPGYAAILASEGFHISPVHQGTTSGRWTTGLTYPIRDDSGEKIGFAALGVDLLHFQEILTELEPPGDGIVTVVERGTDVVVARSVDAEERVGTAPPVDNANSPNDPDFSDRGFSRATTFGGVDYLWGFTRVPGSPWMVYAGLPTEDIYGGIFRQAVLSSLLTLTLLLAAVLLGFRVHRRLTRPLTGLVEEAVSAEPGQRSPLTVDGPEEIALFARRFNEAWNAREAAEEDRRRSDERFRSLVENAVTPIYVSTEDGRFLQVNQAMVDLLGYESREELMATPVSALYASGEDRAATLEEHGEREAFKGVQVEWRRKDGTPSTVRLLGRRVTAQEGETAWEVIVEDVTELTNLQTQYLQAQKMEALGRLAGGIAHDFNNLLTVMQGRADLILADPRVGEDLKEQVREIAEAAARGGALNSQLLAFGRRAPGQDTVLDLNTILGDFEIMLRRAAGEEIRVQLNLTPGLSGIRGARSQVEQVIMNLVVNARDAMAREGELLIETYNAQVSPEEEARYPEAAAGPHVVLAVSDTGTGIEPDVLPNIFEPFFSTKAESEGTGLGLSTVYGIVVDSGGHLRVESSPGEGTTFRAFFPAHSPEAGEATIPKEEALPRTGSGVILLAEDEEAVANLTTQILKRAGYEVLSTPNGEVALETARAREAPIDLLLSDVVMPGLRGPELAQKLAQEGTIDRAVFFSGYADGLEDAALGDLKAWELIPKPFKAAQLLEAIQRVLEA